MTPIEAIGISSGIALVLWLVSRFMGVTPAPSMSLAIVSLLVGKTFFLPSSDFVLESDSYYYWNWAEDIRSNLDAGTALGFSGLWPGKGIWPLLLAVLDVGPGDLMLKSIVANALLLGLAIQISQKTASMILGRKVSTLSTLAVLSSPSLILFGSSPLRETIFWLGVTLVVLGFVTFFHASRGPLGLVEIVGGFVVLLAIRPDASYPIVLYFSVAGTILWLLWFPKSFQIRKLYTALTVVAGLIITAPVASSFFMGNPSTDLVDIKRSALSSASVSTRFEVVPGLPSAFPTGFCEGETFVTLFCIAIPSLPYFFLGPLPQNLGLVSVFLTLSSLHFLAILVLSIRETIFIKSHRSFNIFVLGAVLLSALVFSAVLTNYGIVTRFKVFSLFILAPAGQVALQRLLDRLMFARNKPPRQWF